jgi:hypothetical protein
MPAATGGSTRSPDLAQPNATQAPIVWTDTKVQDAGSVIDFILKRRGVPKLTLMGWSGARSSWLHLRGRP